MPLRRPQEPQVTKPLECVRLHAMLCRQEAWVGELHLRPDFAHEVCLVRSEVTSETQCRFLPWGTLTGYRTFKNGPTLAVHRHWRRPSTYYEVPIAHLRNASISETRSRHVSPHSGWRIHGAFAEMFYKVQESGGCHVLYSVLISMT